MPDSPIIQYLSEKHQPSVLFSKNTHTNEMLLTLYRDMVSTRLFDEKAIALQRTGKLGTYPSSRGQEAIFVGIGHALQENDVFVPYYRDHGTLLQRGIRMEDILAYWGGDERGSQFPSNSEDMPICVPIATQCCHAAGIAKAIKIRQQARAVLAIIGDGGTSKGDFYEALNIAGVWQLPLVFIINNNQWAISTPLSQQTAVSDLSQKAIPAGIESFRVDGNDVIAMQTLTQQALHKARTGQGASLIEAISYRHCDHTTADDASRYEPAGMAEQEWPKEPIRRLQQYLIQQNLWDDTQEQSWLSECHTRIEQSVKNYLTREPQAVSSIFNHLYAVLPEAYHWQRQYIEQHLAN